MSQRIHAFCSKVSTCVTASYMPRDTRLVSVTLTAAPGVSVVNPARKYRRFRPAVLSRSGSSVRQSGMGEVVPIGDSAALADAIIRIFENKRAYVRPSDEIAERWNTERTARGYEALFERLLEAKRRK